MIIALPDMYKTVRRHVGEHETRGRTNPIYILDYINQAWEIIAGGILNLRKDFFSTYYDLTLTGALEYDLPIGVNRIFAVEDITGGATNPIDTDPLNYEQRFLSLLSYKTYFQYYVRTGTFGVPSKSSSGIIRIWYPNRPKKLFYGTITAVTNTTVTFNNGATTGGGMIVPENDYYNGMFLINDDGQFREVTDFVGSTKVFTINSAWSTNPSTSTSVISLASPLSQYQSLISLRAGILWRADLDMPIRDMETQYKIMEAPFLELLQREQTHRSHRVKQFYR